MKNALIITFLIINTIASATDYYISSSGNDSNNGLSSSTPWKTIAKVNSSFPAIKPGDRILFKRGDVFTGQITLTQSGSSTAKIFFDAYGIGNAPIIRGNIDIISWTRFNGNIWVANCPQLGSEVSNLLINGKSQQIGRYPNSDATNKGYLTIKSHSGKTQLTCSSLTSSPDWTGAEAVVRSARWELDRVRIQSQQGDVLIFSEPTTFEIRDNYGFFIQNHINTLDQQGEWYFNLAEKKMYLYSSIDPDSMKTEASAFSSTFMASNQRYFSIENIEFKGSLKTNINILNSSFVEMKNNIISESGADAVYFGDCNNIKYEKNKIINTNSNALGFYNCKNIVANSNEIHNVGLRSGMGKGYTGVNMFYQMQNCTFESNIIDSVGYNGIFFGGDSITVRNNVITNFCMTIDDGAGIYTSGDNILKFYNRTLQNNLIINGIGAGLGTDNAIYTAAEGIYMDDRTSNVEIINNTVANSSRGIYIHNANNISIVGNTLYNNETQLLFVHDKLFPTYPITQCNVNGNIFFSKFKEQFVADFRTIDNGIPNLGTFDNNYYCRPLDNDSTIYAKYTGNLGTISNFMDLSGWQTTFHFDLHSKKSPTTISSMANIDDYIKFFYNPTGSTVTYNMAGRYYIDVKGTKYSGSITLLPYTSAILMIDPDPSAPPVNQPPIITITNPSKGNKYENPTTISVQAIASDPDGTIIKVEFYSGSEKLVEMTLPPYLYTWKDVKTGSYSITAIATDNLNATTTSAPIEFKVAESSKYDANSDVINLYPNPNDGHFSIEFINPLQNEISEVVITDLSGKQVYNSSVLKEETIKQIDLSYIKSGIYILMIFYKKLLVTKKIIKN